MFGEIIFAKTAADDADIFDIFEYLNAGSTFNCFVLDCDGWLSDGDASWVIFIWPLLLLIVGTKMSSTSSGAERFHEQTML